MAKEKLSVAERRNYLIIDVRTARQVAYLWLQKVELEKVIDFGLPEVDDRYHIWRVPLVSIVSKEKIGEVVIDAYTSFVDEHKTTDSKLLEARLLGRSSTERKEGKSKKDKKQKYDLSMLQNTIARGDAEKVLQDLPAESVDLIFTSPPYYNARPEYSDYTSYEEYLLKLRKVIQQSHRVLAEGRFFVMNVSPVLVRRANRSEASHRIAVPFDVHRLFVEEGYDIIDDIIWLKPEGAGWATSRGRRFAADRNPLQYKAVPVTEYVLVYRKHTSKLIDWNIRAHPKPEIVKSSRIGDNYERTNVWRISPTHDKRHPAIFPLELAEKVITYYSFKGDVVLDPFAGIGTVGQAAVKLERRFVLIDQNPKYVDVMREECKKWLGTEARHIHTTNCSEIQTEDRIV